MNPRAVGEATVAEREVAILQTNDFSDRWNPMLVRELRRMLKSRLFGASFLLLLIGCLIGTYTLVAMYPGTVQYDEAGKLFANVYLWLFTGPLMFVVPLSMFLAVSQERLENTLEMLSITTLSTRQILKGFLLCGFAHALLYLSVLVPFISFSYLLMGLGLMDLLACLFALSLLGGTNALWSTMLGACVSGSISRAVCSIFSFLGNLLAFSIAVTMNTAIIRYGGEPDFPAMFICLITMLVPMMLMFYGIAHQQLTLYDITLKPYRVILDEQGNIRQFKPYYNAPYYEVPQSMQPNLALTTEQSRQSS